MSKKRGASSPSESDKMKLKPTNSAATSTLGMAAVLSAVSHVFSGGASSAITDSEDEYQSQCEENENGNALGSGSEENPWEESNLNRSQVKSPRYEKEKPKALFESYQDGAIRDQIEIEIQTKNGKKFTGSITPLEIKHNIYIDALKFPDHENFDGARVGFKGKLVATIKLINPINIDTLSDTEYFEFTRTTFIRGKKTEEIIGCKIKGVRWQPNTVSAFENPKHDDERTLVKIEGCEYQVPEEIILSWLSHYGEIKSELEEDLFKDTKETGGNNRTGNYSLMMILEHKIPQLLPMNGRRVKIYHRGIDKLCTKCFGKHKKSECKSETKTEWLDYVRHFMNQNDFIPVEFFGRWNDLVKTVITKTQQQTTTIQQNDDKRNDSSKEQTEPKQSTSTQDNQKQREEDKPAQILPPREEDFGIPTTETEYESMVERMASCGFTKADLTKILETKKTAFNKAEREYRNLTKKQQPKGDKPARKTRKDSIPK